MDAALAGDDALAATLDCEVVPGWASFVEALEPTRNGLVGAPDGAAWGPRLFLADDPRRVVGWGGFKGAPRDGMVELGYEIAESCRRRGHATAAVRAMVAEAFSSADVTMVIAHTLPERNPSNELLGRLGFTFDREVRQGDEIAWRFVLLRSSSDAAGHPETASGQTSTSCRACRPSPPAPPNALPDLFDRPPATRWNAGGTPGGTPPDPVER
jgi:RimJ/RimL family protein N-acetyltransferase